MTTEEQRVAQAWCAGSSKVPTRTTHDAAETQSALCPECDSYVGISRGDMVALHRAPRPCCTTWRECPHGLASAGLPIPTEVRERRCDPSTPQGYEVFCGFAGLHGGHLLPSGTWCAGTPRETDEATGDADA